MCGITAAISKENACAKVVQMLGRLEYRGYDSVGYCTIKEDSTFHIVKQLKPPTQLAVPIVPTTPTSITIAHTRWATHGPPTIQNCHPHLSDDEQIAIVHNGTIENYEQLKNLLIEEHDIHCKSDTDSEAVAHLMQIFSRENDFFTSAKATFMNINGTFAIVAMHRETKRLVAGCVGSPLVMGKNKTEMWFASDSTGVPEDCKIFVLNDGDVISASCHNFKRENLFGPCEPMIELKHSGYHAMENVDSGTPHMLREIRQQLNVVEELLSIRLKDTTITFPEMDNIKSKLIDSPLITIIGCGTSLNAGLILEYYISHILHTHCRVISGSEFDASIQVGTVLVLSQSGETYDVIQAVKRIKKKDPKTIVIGFVNRVASSLTRIVDETIPLYCGIEKSVAATKSFSAQVLCSSLFVNYLAGNLPTSQVTETPYHDLPNLILQTHGQIEETVKTMAQKYFQKKLFVFLGSGILFPVAKEAALKASEISYVPSLYFYNGELKHGPLALIDQNTLVVTLNANNNIVSEILARKGNVLSITDEDDHLADLDVVKLPRIEYHLKPLIYTIPLQLFAYHVAALNGRNIDLPRNLAKSVTV